MHADRNAIFDYAKGIGILLVVYGHVARGVYNAGLPIDQGFYDLADSIIYSFHMPLFFFISGCFFLRSMEKRGTVSLVGSKIGTVLYPYVVWSLIQGLLEVTLSAHTNGNVTLEQVLSLWTPRAQFWFLYVLFGAFLLAVLLYRKATPAWTSLVLGIAVLYYLSGYSPADVYMLNALPHWFVFFALGVSGSHVVTRFNLGGYGWSAVIAALFVLGQWGFHQNVESLAENYASLAKLVLGLLGIGLVFTLGRHAGRLNWNWLGYIGRYSLEIYLIHVMASSGVRIVLQKFLGITDPSLHLMIGTLAGVVVPLAFVMVSRSMGTAWLFAAPDLNMRRRLAHASSR